MQQLDWQCAIKLESVAVLLVNSMVGYLCGASDCSRKKNQCSLKVYRIFLIWVIIKSALYECQKQKEKAFLSTSGHMFEVAAHRSKKTLLLV